MRIDGTIFFFTTNTRFWDTNVINKNENSLEIRSPINNFLLKIHNKSDANNKIP